MKVPPENSEETCDGGSRESKLAGMLDGDEGQARDACCQTCWFHPPAFARTGTVPRPTRREGGAWLRSWGGTGHQLLLRGREMFLSPAIKLVSLSPLQFLICKTGIIAVPLS